MIESEKVKASYVRARRWCNCDLCNLDEWKRWVVIGERCHNFLLPLSNMLPSWFHNTKSGWYTKAWERERNRERGKLSQMGVACCSLWSASMYPKHLLLLKKEEKKSSAGKIYADTLHLGSVTSTQSGWQRKQKTKRAADLPQDVVNVFPPGSNRSSLWRSFLNITLSLRAQTWTLEAARRWALIRTGNQTHSAGSVQTGGVRGSSENGAFQNLNCRFAGLFAAQRCALVLPPRRCWNLPLDELHWEILRVDLCSCLCV